MKEIKLSYEEYKVLEQSQEDLRKILKEGTGKHTIVKVAENKRHINGFGDIYCPYVEVVSDPDNTLGGVLEKFNEEKAMILHEISVARGLKRDEELYRDRASRLTEEIEHNYREITEKQEEIVRLYAKIEHLSIGLIALGVLFIIFAGIVVFS